MAQLFALSARSALAAGITSTSTSMTVDASTSDLFPVANTGTGAVGTDGLDWFKVILEDADYNKEVVYVRTRTLGSAIMTNLLRGQEGTTARSFLGGSVVGLRHTAVDLQDAIEFASDPRAELIEYTPAGAGATITDVQARLRAYEASGGSALIGHQTAGAVATTVQARLRAYEEPTGSNLMGYQPAGTGAIDTTVQNQLRQLNVNVKNYGLSETASKAENTAAFTAAMAAVVTGGWLVIPPGSFLADITITKSLNVIGTGKPRYNGSALVGGTVIKGTVTAYTQGVHLGWFGIDQSATTDQDGLVCGSSTDTDRLDYYFHNLALVGRNGGGGSLHGIVAQGGEHVCIENCDAFKFYHNFAVRTSYSTISNCYSEDADGSSYIFKSGSTFPANNCRHTFAVNFTARAKTAGRVADLII